jgi:hypothetical protein
VAGRMDLTWFWRRSAGLGIAGSLPAVIALTDESLVSERV